MHCSSSLSCTFGPKRVCRRQTFLLLLLFLLQSFLVHSHICTNGRGPMPELFYPEWRRANQHLAHTDMQQNMADWRMAHLMDKVTSDSAAKERKPATVPKLPHHQPHQPPKQSNAENHPEQTQTPSRKYHCRRARRVSSREKHN